MPSSLPKKISNADFNCNKQNMINVETILKIKDNSGGIYCGCIKVLKTSSRVGALSGHVITVSIKKNIFKKHVIKKSKIIIKGQICKALVIRSAIGVKRWGNFFLKSKHNSVILINQYMLPYATRLFGPVFREVRSKMVFLKVIALAQVTF